MIEEIKKGLDILPDSQKAVYLKEKLDQEKDFEEKKRIREIYIKHLKEKAIVKLDNNEPVEFQIVYDSMSEGLEPIYFWVLDFMRSSEPSGLGLEVNKTEEEFESSASSGYFGEMGTRASVMQDRAIKTLQTVNTVVRSIINLLYDLREFDIRLSGYDKLKSRDPDDREGAELALKAIWMDLVDIKKGRGSINMMTQQLQFVTLRDAFMQAKNEKDAEQMDINKRVKGILKRKISEYLEWKKYSEQELRKRRNIEKAYLRSQIDSLKLYTKWARPYLRAAQKLGMKEFVTTAGLPSPDLVAAFNNMMQELTLFGKKEIKPKDVFETYAKKKFTKKYYACLEADFRFRTVPQSLRTQTGSQYVHSGVTEIFFKAYVFSDEEIEELEKQELYLDMDLVDNLTKVSLKELEKDVENYLKEDKKEEKKKKAHEFKWPLGNVFIGIRESVINLDKGIKSIFKIKREPESYPVKKIKEKAKEEALSYCNIIYDVYKKAHGMMTW